MTDILKRVLAGLRRQVYEVERDLAEMGCTRVFLINRKRLSGRTLLKHLTEQADILNRRITTMTEKRKQKPHRIIGPSRGRRGGSR